MKIKVSIKNFLINSEDSSLKGKIENPEFLLVAAKLRVPEFPDIDGCIVELFSVTDLKQVENRTKGISFNIGDWYVRIKIFEGWEYFQNLEVKEFYIEENKNKNQNIKKSHSSNSFLFQLKNVSGRHFSNFYIDLRGGSTEGTGRSEHGEPHFHIIKKGSNEDLGKVFYPSITDYNNNKTELVFNANITKKQKKEVIKWVFESELKNLRMLNETWNLMNKNNNRVI